jgi:hypothetical protein
MDKNINQTMYHYFFVFCYFILWLLSQRNDDPGDEYESDGESSNASDHRSNESDDESFNAPMEVDSITSDEHSDGGNDDFVTEVDIKSVQNYSGWRSNAKIHVRYDPEYILPEKRSQNGYYKGIVKRKKGRKFDVHFPDTGATDTITPTESQWYYSDQVLQEWPTKENIILEKNTLRPFQYKKERDGNWTGAKTCATVTASLRIWSIPNTPYVHIGHIGVYECVTAGNDGTIRPLYGVQRGETQYFFGRRKMKNAIHFRDFRPVCRNAVI